MAFATKVHVLNLEFQKSQLQRPALLVPTLPLPQQSVATISSTALNTYLREFRLPRKSHQHRPTAPVAPPLDAYAVLRTHYLRSNSTKNSPLISIPMTATVFVAPVESLAPDARTIWTCCSCHKLSDFLACSACDHSWVECKKCVFVLRELDTALWVDGKDGDDDDTVTARGSN